MIDLGAKNIASNQDFGIVSSRYSLEFSSLYLHKKITKLWRKLRLPQIFDRNRSQKLNLLLARSHWLRVLVAYKSATITQWLTTKSIALRIACPRRCIFNRSNLDFVQLIYFRPFHYKLIHFHLTWYFTAFTAFWLTYLIYAKQQSIALIDCLRSPIPCHVLKQNYLWYSR